MSSIGSSKREAPVTLHCHLSAALSSSLFLVGDQKAFSLSNPSNRAQFISHPFPFGNLRSFQAPL